MGLVHAPSPNFGKFVAPLRESGRYLACRGCIYGQSRLAGRLLRDEPRHVLILDNRRIARINNLAIAAAEHCDIPAKFRMFESAHEFRESRRLRDLARQERMRLVTPPFFDEAVRREESVLGYAQLHVWRRLCA